jgi:hypothetical protein
MKFDVVLGSGPHRVDGTYVLEQHVAQHLHFIKFNGYYVEILPDTLVQHVPKILADRHSRFCHIITAPVLFTAPSTKGKQYYIWKKE